MDQSTAPAERVAYAAQHLGAPAIDERSKAREVVDEVVAAQDYTRRAIGKHRAYGDRYRPRPLEYRKPVERAAVAR
jgi:hypothetical protein